MRIHSGQSLRLYISADIKGKRTVLDIPFRIRDVYKNRPGQEAPAPAAAAPLAPAPAPASQKTK